MTSTTAIYRPTPMSGSSAIYRPTGPSTTACGVGADLGPGARLTALETDAAYVRMLEAQSTWPYRYNMGVPQPRCLGTPILGLNAPHVGVEQVDAYNALLPRHMRVKVRASRNRPQTELYGTAPYMAVGRGALMYADIDTQLRVGNRVSRDNNRALMETNLTREEFVHVPRELRDLPFDARLGVMTRVGPEYAR